MFSFSNFYITGKVRVIAKAVSTRAPYVHSSNVSPLTPPFLTLLHFITIIIAIIINTICEGLYRYHVRIPNENYANIPFNHSSRRLIDNFIFLTILFCFRSHPKVISLFISHFSFCIALFLFTFSFFLYYYWYSARVCVITTVVVVNTCTL